MSNSLISRFVSESVNQLSAAQPVAVSQPVKQYTLAEIFGLTFEEQTILQLA